MALPLVAQQQDRKARNQRGWLSNDDVFLITHPGAATQMLTDPSQPSWGFLEWAISVVTPMLATAFGFLNHRINGNEALVRKVQTELRAEIAEVGRASAAAIELLNRRIEDRLTGLQTRLDQTPTKTDMRDWIEIILRSHERNRD